MPHTSAGTMRQNIEQPRILWPIEQSRDLAPAGEIYLQIRRLTDHWLA
jgi:hypothetical protein